MNDNVTELQVVTARKEQAMRNASLAKRSIWVTFQKEGIHSFPEALTSPLLEDVSFLGHPHRHIFHFRVQIQVLHNDRDIEFIQFKRWLQSLYENAAVLSVDSQSCEMIADDLYTQIAVKYPDRDVIIEVSEDNENGCCIEYPNVRKFK